MHVTTWAVGVEGPGATSVDTSASARRDRDHAPTPPSTEGELDAARIIALQRGPGNRSVGRVLDRAVRAAGSGRHVARPEPPSDRQLRHALARTASARAVMGRASRGEVRGRRAGPEGDELELTSSDRGVRPVQRVLTGTAAALKPLTPTGEGAERVAWSEIYAALAVYETLELEFVAEGEMASREPLTAMLAEIIHSINSYPSEDGAEAARRRTTLAVLVPRLAHHRNRLLLRQPIASGFGPLTSAEGQIESGSMSDIQKVSYGGSKPGFYKVEPLTKQVKTKNSIGTEVPGRAVPLDLEEPPNYGARSVALYALDQMLLAASKGNIKSPLIVNTEFAVLGPQLGIVMARAVGVAADSELPVGPGDLPMFMGCITRLQMLDAIATQVDRHLGNYYIGYDVAGKSAFIWGIDNDLAFTRKAKPGGDATGEIANVGDYRGMPPIVDHDLAEAILAVDDRQLPLVLGGVLDAVALLLLRRRLIQMQKSLKEISHLWIGHAGWEKLPLETAKLLTATPTYWKTFSTRKLEPLVHGTVTKGLGEHPTKASAAKALVWEAAQKLLVKGLITHATLADETNAFVKKYAEALVLNRDVKLLEVMNGDELWKQRG